MTSPWPSLARRLMIIVDEDASIGRQPVYTEIVERAHRAGLAGASVFRGIEGFGSSRQIHTSRILSLAENLPAMIVIIDTSDAIERFLPQLADLGVRGVIAVDDVELAQPGTVPGGRRRMTVLMIALGAALGAPARYLTDRAIQSRHETVFPWGTLAVNVAASLILGFLTGAGSNVDATVSALVGTGFCAALSTYSTFSYETMRLAQDGARFYAVANIAVSLVAGIGAAALGWSLGVSAI